MNAVALDTLRVAKRLRDAGFFKSQAESVTDAIREGVTGGDLATKDDIRVLKADLDLAVGNLRTEMADVKSEILKWRSGMMVAQSAFIVTVIKVFPGK